jgi:hypothetical protein
LRSSPFLKAIAFPPRNRPIWGLARGSRKGWACWGVESEEYIPTWDTYANHSQTSNPVYVAKALEAKPKKPILSPAIFIEKALRASKGRELKAGAVYAAYEAECIARDLRAVKAIGFSQTLSARAKKLGAVKGSQGGRVVYFGLDLAA